MEGPSADAVVHCPPLCGQRSNPLAPLSKVDPKSRVRTRPLCKRRAESFRSSLVARSVGQAEQLRLAAA